MLGGRKKPILSKANIMRKDIQNPLSPDFIKEFDMVSLSNFLLSWKYKLNTKIKLI